MTPLDLDQGAPMPDPDHNSIAQEIEFQTRRVAGLERFIAQIDLDLRLSEEMRLISEKARKEYVKKTEQERNYLDWLTNEASAESSDG